MLKLQKKLNANASDVTIKNFIAATNAFAKKYIEEGKTTKFLSAQNATKTYYDILRAVSALADSTDSAHNSAWKNLKNSVGARSSSLAFLENIGSDLNLRVSQIASELQKKNLSADKTKILNAMAGDRFYDHFANVGRLASQMMQDLSYIPTFLDDGNAFAAELTAGNTGRAKSRFRVPVEKISGSPGFLTAI